MLTMIMARSAAGKTTIVDRMTEKYGYEKVVTSTTRPMRPGEIDGKDYHFLTPEEFDAMESRNEFAESKAYHPASGGVWKYGSAIPKDYLDDDRKHLLIVTPAGVRDIKAHFGKDAEKILTVYLRVPEKELERRLRARGDDTKEAERRIRADRDDFKDAEKDADVVIENYGIRNNNRQIEKTIREIKHAEQQHETGRPRKEAHEMEGSTSSDIEKLKNDVQTLGVSIKEPSDIPADEITITGGNLPEYLTRDTSDRSTENLNIDTDNIDLESR